MRGRGLHVSPAATTVVSPAEFRSCITLSYQVGEHDYIDVIIDGADRILIDMDFRSEFKVARSTKSYRALLQYLPSIFVGTADRVSRIVSVTSVDSC